MMRQSEHVDARRGGTTTVTGDSREIGRATMNTSRNVSERRA
jgi:hypothetical protein